MNMLLKRQHRILYVLILQTLLLYMGPTAFSQETKETASNKKKYQDIEVGPFRLDLGGFLESLLATRSTCDSPGDRPKNWSC
jgi:hypothetical protein